jgi:hypothetical protein
MTAASYVSSANLTSTTLTITIDETSYYIKNVQSPIAKQSEIIFRTLLFTILCLEISALIFLVIKLLVIPLCTKIYAISCGKRNNMVAPEETIPTHHHNEDH